MKGKSTLVGREEPKGNFGKNLVEEAKENGVPIEGKSLSIAEQQKLMEEDGAPTPSVIEGKMLAKFLKPHFERSKDGEVFVALEFSIALAPTHEKLLDPTIIDAWKYISQKHPTRIDGIDVPAQTVDLYLAPEMDSELHLTAAEVSNAKISRVERNGDGESEIITRLQFRLISELSKNVTLFATTQVANAIWIKMGAAQGSLAVAAGA